MDNPSAEFDAEDLAAIDLAMREHDAENPDPSVDETGNALPGAPAPAAHTPAPPAASEQAPAPPAPAPAPTPTAPAAAPAATAPAAPAPAPAAPAPEPAEHHLNAALRVARTQAERLRIENEALKAASAAPAAPAVKRPDDDALKDLAGFDPEAVAYMKELERRNTELAAQAARAPAAPAPASEFIPLLYPAAVQTVIDTVPELLAMQLNPDQTAFKVAIKQDSILELLPEWAGKSAAARYAEAARLANAVVKGTTTAAPPPPQAGGATPTEAEKAAALAAAQRALAGNPVAIGDLRGGASPTTDEKVDYRKMTNDEDVMADLDRYA